MDYHVRGERVRTAKLTEAKVLEAWAMKARGMTQAGIAEALGVTQTAIQNVFSGRYWKHVRPGANLG